MNPTSGNPTITMKEAAALLNYKTVTSLRKWCRASGVKIYKDKGGRKFLILSLLLDAHLHEFKKDLQIQYGSIWEDIFKIYMGEDVATITDIQNVRQTMTNTKTTYKPTGPEETRFLQSLLTKNTVQL